MKIYNSNALNRNSRFGRALAAGLVAAVLFGIVYGVFVSLVRIEAAVLYIGIGWAIGEVIKKAGRGVGTQFCVLGAVLTLLAVLIGDTVALAGVSGAARILITPALWPSVIRTLLARVLSVNLNSLLALLIRGAGIVYGYTNSSIV